MESFLSLPRSAKGGLAVLLAVALLGWGIVAYSSKRQHDDAKSLENALVTLKSKTETEKTAVAELDDLRERLSATETDLSTSQQEKGEIEARIAELETDLDSRNNALADLEAELSALANDDDAMPGKTAASGLPSEKEAEAPGNIDIETLRGRLSKTMTALSARSATLAQRDRELEQARAEHTAAMAEIESLEAGLVEQGVLRERLSKTMTTLSARSATLAQRDRQFERTQADYEAATARIEILEADLAAAEKVRTRLNKTMTDLSARSATLAQRDRELENLKTRHETAMAALATFEADQAKREGNEQTLSSLQIRVDRTEQALKDGAKALTTNQKGIADSEIRLSELRTETAALEKSIEEKQATLTEREQQLGEINQSIEAAETKLADLKVAQGEAEAMVSSLTAEVEHQQGTLTNKEDAIAYANTDLKRLKKELTATTELVGKSEMKLEEKLTQINDGELQIKAVETSLAALKQDHLTVQGDAAELQTTIGEQEATLEDLKAVKSELEVTKTELVYQQTILADRQEQIQLADARLDQLQNAVRDASSRDQTFARIPIAAVSRDNLAVLPIDPLSQPFPVQTPEGIRLALVHFELGSAELTPGGLRRAKEAAAWIKEQEVDKIRLVGATDTIGTRENNMALAKRRAQSLLDAFTAEGIDPDRIELVSAGEAGGGEVIADQTAEPLNRCVGVFISAAN